MARSAAASPVSGVELALLSPAFSMTCAEPIVVFGAIAATWLAYTRNMPAEADIAPCGDTYTITGTRLASDPLHHVLHRVDQPARRVKLDHERIGPVVLGGLDHSVVILRADRRNGEVELGDVNKAARLLREARRLPSW